MYEYHNVVFSSSARTRTRQLNQLASEGWELVTLSSMLCKATLRRIHTPGQAPPAALPITTGGIVFLIISTTLMLLFFGLVTGAWAGGTTCTTRDQADFRRYVTECRDGSRSVTRYERDFKRWRTEVTKPATRPPQGKEKTR
jgi:hypothetical protein